MTLHTPITQMIFQIEESQSEEIGNQLELASYSSVITAQARSRGGSARTAQAVLEKMRLSDDAEMRPTAMLTNVAMDAHSKCGDGSAAAAAGHGRNGAPRHHQLQHRHQLFRSAGAPRPASCILPVVPHVPPVCAGCRCSAHAYSHPLFSPLSSHPSLAAKCHDGGARGAMKIFNEMREAGVPANAVTYHSLMNAQVRQADGNARDALRILDEMVRGNEAPDLSIFTTVRQTPLEQESERL